MPGSLEAGGLTLALVPGYIFLLLTRGVRKPREQTSLQELLEVVVVGAMTTGSTVTLATIVWASGFTDPFADSSRSDSSLRQAAVNAGATFLGSIALACIAALIAFLVLRGRSYESNVWSDVFGEKVAGDWRHVSFELVDGRTFDGPLRGYTVLPGPDGARQIAIQAPIRCTLKNNKKPINLDWENMVVDVSAIAFATMDHIRDPGNKTG